MKEKSDDTVSHLCICVCVCGRGSFSVVSSDTEINVKMSRQNKNIFHFYGGKN